MFRPFASTLKNAAVARVPLQGQTRKYAKATLMGRLGAAPEQKTTAKGTNYYRYSIGVESLPKKDANGEVQKDANGYPVRDTKWYSIFAFDRAAEHSEQMRVGAKYLVDAQLDLIQTQTEDGKTHNNVILRESSHRLVASPAQKQ